MIALKQASPAVALAALLLVVASPSAGQDGRASELELLPVQGNVHALFGPGGNTAVQVGPEGVLLVDTQTSSVSDQILEVVGALSSRPIRHIVLTSADSDHAGGAAALSEAGAYVRLIDSFDPRGSDTRASIIAHVNVLARMSAPTGTEAAAPPEAWPTDTYFSSEWSWFVNGEAVQLFHVPGAHTDGDTIVFFRRSDVVSTGDIFNTTGFPRFNSDEGGSVDGVIEGLNLILDLAIAGENQEGGTVVVPGHGRLSDETDVANYRDMVTIVRDRVRALIEQGLTLEQVQAAKPAMDYDGQYHEAPGTWTGAQFVEAVYKDLSGGAR